MKEKKDAVKKIEKTVVIPDKTEEFVNLGFETSLDAKKEVANVVNVEHKHFSQSEVKDNYNKPKIGKIKELALENEFPQLEDDSKLFVNSNVQFASVNLGA